MSAGTPELSINVESELLLVDPDIDIAYWTFDQQATPLGKKTNTDTNSSESVRFRIATSLLQLQERAYRIYYQTIGESDIERTVQFIDADYPEEVF